MKLRSFLLLASRIKSHKYWRHLVLMWHQSWWVFLLSLGLLLSLAWDARSLKSDQDAAPLDTFIPKGHVLVPVELSNHKAVSSLLGAYGVVDLYPPAGKGPGRGSGPHSGRAQKSRYPVAQQVRIVRSPHSASHFAALVPQHAATQLMDLGARFHAVLQNPNVAPRLEMRYSASHRVQIIVEDEVKPKR